MNFSPCSNWLTDWLVVICSRIPGSPARMPISMLIKERGVLGLINDQGIPPVGCCFCWDVAVILGSCSIETLLQWSQLKIVFKATVHYFILANSWVMSSILATDRLTGVYVGQLSDHRCCSGPSISSYKRESTTCAGIGRYRLVDRYSQGLSVETTWRGIHNISLIYALFGIFLLVQRRQRTCDYQFTSHSSNIPLESIRTGCWTGNQTLDLLSWARQMFCHSTSVIDNHKIFRRRSIAGVILSWN